ncbi:MAG: hypothetical protein VZR54_06270 [Ruminococcus sp.]|nr:hypothetical protein [Ruminococcus sp.]
MIKLFDTKNIYGTFGLERETLRVTSDGYMAQTPHPFPDDEHIVKDFCENQAEINTGVHNTAQGAINELKKHSERLKEKIKKRGESLWMYSNPPHIKNENDIPVAVYEGDQKSKHSYRKYLAEKYGKYKMTLSGIHVNYSLSEELLKTAFSKSDYSDYTEFKNSAYLRLAQGLTEYGWIINLLLSASPVCDGSYLNPKQIRETVITEYASVRCGKEGYWNDFTPVLSYDSILSYADSIQKYIDNGSLAGVGELYYPIRLKPKGVNRLNNLVQNGVNHIELRNIDINPFAEEGIDVRDLEFLELLMLWIFCTYEKNLSETDQIHAVEIFKNSALYDIDNTTIPADNKIESLRTAGLRILSEMREFFGDSSVLQYQFQKLTEQDARYADKVRANLKDNYINKVIIGG